MASIMKTIAVMIGNTDNKLTQQRWSEFCSDVRAVIEGAVSARGNIYGEWFSASDAPWQNAAWCVEVDEQDLMLFRHNLIEVRKRYSQDSIGWMESDVEFL